MDSLGIEQMAEARLEGHHLLVVLLGRAANEGIAKAMGTNVYSVFPCRGDFAVCCFFGGYRVDPACDYWQT